jgi:hypothetical protein
LVILTCHFRHTFPQLSASWQAKQLPVLLLSGAPQARLLQLQELLLHQASSAR